MSDKYILNEAGEPVQCDDLMAWAHWYQSRRTNNAWIVGKTKVTEGVEVSTVFLSLDHWFGSGPHAPLLWESMCFGGPLDNECDRYATRQEAEAGHASMVARVKAALALAEPPTH